MGLDTYGRLYATVYKGDNFYVFRFLFRYTKHFLKRVYSKRKEFAPTGSKFFPVRVDPFEEGKQNTSDRVIAPDSVPILPFFILKQSFY